MQNYNSKLKVGVVGLGHQALEDHIPAIEVSPDVELVGVMEINKEKLKTF
jgi:predicted dehydrogenase